LGHDEIGRDRRFPRPVRCLGLRHSFGVRVLHPGDNKQVHMLDHLGSCTPAKKHSRRGGAEYWRSRQASSLPLLADAFATSLCGRLNWRRSRIFRAAGAGITGRTEIMDLMLSATAVCRGEVLRHGRVRKQIQEGPRLLPFLRGQTSMPTFIARGERPSSELGVYGTVATFHRRRGSRPPARRYFYCGAPFRLKISAEGT
jgi:hypothetical protein